MYTSYILKKTTTEALSTVVAILLYIRYTTKTGPANGLILEMDIEQNDYLPLTPTAGIKVLLHPGSEIPFPEDGGITVGPGFVTNVGVKKVKQGRDLPTGAMAHQHKLQH